MKVDHARKALYFVAVTALFIVFCGYTPAGAFNNEPVDHTLLLAQATQESADKQSETPSDEVPDQAEQDEDDEYDDDEYDDEYEDDDVELISDPLIQGNTDFYNFNDTMYFWVLKPVAESGSSPSRAPASVINTRYLAS